MASNRYERDENWNDVILAARGFTEDEIPQVLAAMVNPPPVPADMDALEWVPRIQLAATQVVGHVGGGWQSSGDALPSALWGPRDWIAVAALITLAHLAEENREIELDVHDAFKMLSECIPDGGYCCFEHALFTCWQWLPSRTEDEKRRLQERVLDLEE